MGSFSATCGISDLAISSGDPIVMIILAKNRYYSETNDLGVLYPSGEWGPVGLPFFGQYDDYGGIESIEENAATAFTLSLIQKHILPDPGERYEGQQDPPPEVDPEGDPGPLTLDELCDRDINRRHYRSRGKPLNLKRMFIHRRIYDFLINEQTFEDRDFRDTTGAATKMRAAIQEKLAAFDAQVDEYVKLGVTPQQAEAMAGMRMYDVQRLLTGGEGQQFLGGEELLEFDRDLLLAEWPQVMALHIAMMYLRKTYRPVNTVGEQYTPPHRYLGYLKAVNAFVAEQVAEVEADEAAEEAAEIEAIVGAKA